MPTDDERRPRLSQALYEDFRARIADGTYVAGAALPSTRALATERGLSRATVTLVYEQLAAEGFIETRTGAASRVAVGAGPPRGARQTRVRTAAPNNRLGVCAAERFVGRLDA